MASLNAPENTPREAGWFQFYWPAAAIVLAGKLAIAVTVAIAISRFPTGFIEQPEINFLWPDGPRDWRLMLSTWDAQHYLMLSQTGYSPSAPLSYAFPPIWPTLIRLFQPLFAGSALISGLVLSNASSFVAIMIMYRVVHNLYGRRPAVWTIAVFVAFPGSVFFSLAFTESVFFLALMLLVSGLLNGRNSVVAVAAFVMPLIRSVGVFVAVPLVAFLGSKRPTRRLLIAAVPMLGYAAYFLWMYIESGNPFSGMRAYDLFIAKPSTHNLVDIPGFVRHFVAPTPPLALHGPTNSIIDRAFFLCLLVSLPAIWRHSKPAFLLTLALGVLPGIATGMMSYTRYLAVVFPFFIALGNRFEGMKPVIGILVIEVLLLVQLRLLWAHVHFYWFA